MRYPKIFPTCKAAGEWVEMVFTVKAGALGLAVSKPYGDSQPYDFLVSRRHLSPARIQVKSSFSKRRGLYYVCMKHTYYPYAADEFDFIVIYIPPEDA